VDKGRMNCEGGRMNNTMGTIHFEKTDYSTGRIHSDIVPAGGNGLLISDSDIVPISDSDIVPAKLITSRRKWIIN
jgi:hypothetical protein